MDYINKASYVIYVNEVWQSQQLISSIMAQFISSWILEMFIQFHYISKPLIQYDTHRIEYQIRATKWDSILWTRVKIKKLSQTHKLKTSAYRIFLSTYFIFSIPDQSTKQFRYLK